MPSENKKSGGRGRGKRRLRLDAALRQAKKAGHHVKGAVVYVDHVELAFGELNESESVNPWDKATKELTKQ